MDKFKVGDRVRIIGDCDVKGLEAEILSQRQHRTHYRLRESWFVYLLDIQGCGTKGFGGRPFGLPEHWLTPLYDGYEKTTWDECYWKPKSLEEDNMSYEVIIENKTISAKRLTCLTRGKKALVRNCHITGMSAEFYNWGLRPQVWRPKFWRRHD